MTTFTEWEESVYADEGKNCQYCHMPQVEGEIATGIVSERGKRIFSHDLAGSHSITQLKKALALKVVSVEPEARQGNRKSRCHEYRLWSPRSNGDADKKTYPLLRGAGAGRKSV